MPATQDDMLAERQGANVAPPLSKPANFRRFCQEMAVIAAGLMGDRP